MLSLSMNLYVMYSSLRKTQDKITTFRFCERYIMANMGYEPSASDDQVPR